MPEAERPKKRVWILGAGFSRSLGGPLMFDLLSAAAYRHVSALYKEHVAKEDADLVFWLYHYGCAFPEGSLDPEIAGDGEHRWKDAEQFLEILDTARADQATATAVREAYEGLRGRMVARYPDYKKQKYPGAFSREQPPALDALAWMAKRMVAASCCAFLDGVTRDNALKKERWLPYENWMSCLRVDDTILTFNYDLVVEMLRPEVGSGTRGAHVAGSGDDSLAEARRIPTLYKLHGSVNWNIEQDFRVTRADWTPAMLGTAFNLAIATPGDSKMKMADGMFGRLWDSAATKLREADEIYIIGFRFPQGDAHPRDQLLGALRHNMNSSVEIHVILGPEHSADRARVLALLQWTLGTRAVVDPGASHGPRALYAHSMYAEDFLTVWAGNQTRVW